MRQNMLHFFRQLYFRCCSLKQEVEHLLAVKPFKEHCRGFISVFGLYYKRSHCVLLCKHAPVLSNLRKRFNCRRRTEVHEIRL